MIFKPLNATVEKKAYTVRIQNMDVANGHWGTEKSIVSWLEEIDGLSYDRERFSRNLVKHSLDILNYNIRVDDMTFYSCKNQIILLEVADRRSFIDVDFLSRKIEIELKNQNLTFSVVEILKPEQKELLEGKKILPKEWIIDNELNDLLGKLKNFI